MSDIKFGTDGWRAIIGDQFTTANVSRISEAVSKWMLQKGYKKVILGYDTRMGGPMFSRTATMVFAANGIRVLQDNKVVTTPMISYAVKKLGADLGIVITASHNPAEYNGYKIKASFGGPAVQDDLSNIESLIPEQVMFYEDHYETYLSKGIVEIIDLEELYLNMLRTHFDLPTLTGYSQKIIYDSMYGAGRNLMKRLFPAALHLHDSQNPGFEGISPEPIGKNLELLEKTMKANQGKLLGIANDGDADRVGLFDERGRFIDSHHILLLLFYYLVKIKGMKGRIVASAAVTEKLENIAKTYKLPFQYTKIGFKNITPIILQEEVILAGEEAGGMAVSSHIPERDGIYIALVILEFIISSGKTLSQLVELVYQEVGSFSYDRRDLHLSAQKKAEIVGICENDQIVKLAGEKILRISKVDGFRYYLPDEKWVMIRPSGTEPVLRIYAQAKNDQAVQELLRKVISELKD